MADGQKEEDRVSVCERGVGQCSGAQIFELRTSSRVHVMEMAQMISLCGCHEGDKGRRGMLEVVEGLRKHCAQRHALINRRTHRSLNQRW